MRGILDPWKGSQGSFPPLVPCCLFVEEPWDILPSQLQQPSCPSFSSPPQPALCYPGMTPWLAIWGVCLEERPRPSPGISSERALSVRALAAPWESPTHSGLLSLRILGKIREMEPISARYLPLQANHWLYPEYWLSLKQLRNISENFDTRQIRVVHN